MSAAMNSLTALSDELVNLIASTLPSTVTISGSSSNFMSGGSGSGWVYDDFGHVVTNHHVVASLVHPIKVKPVGAPDLIGVVIGIDRENDLAVLKVEDLKRPPLVLRDSQARLGEICIAIGSPLGLQESASLGIVSGTGRQGKGQDGFIIEEMIQTDASVNPGNSGGPLIDSRGNVIGMNTMGHGETVNFAVASETLADTVPELIAHGEIKRASIGVSIAAQWRQFNGVMTQSIVVRSVKDQNSPLQEGDFILKLNEIQTRRRFDIRKALDRKSIGRELSAEVERDGKLLHLTIVANGR
jgi:serine protease Do